MQEEYFEVKGNEGRVVSALSEYMSEGSAKVVFNNRSRFKGIFEEGEVYKEICESAEEDTSKLGLMIPKTNYYINLKRNTIVLIGVLLDVRFTKGFLSAGLGVLGITADKIRKLSDKEKCVLLLIKSKAVIVESKEQYMAKKPLKCMNYVSECDDRDYNRCNISGEELNIIVSKLKEQNIIKQVGDILVYCF